MNDPVISVVVPTLNEAQHINACLEALQQQSIGRESYEIVVVDNGSTDGTRELVKRFATRLLQEIKPSPYAARNRAINSTRGLWLAFTDATCIAEPTWLEMLLKSANQTGSRIVGGLTRYEVLTPTLGNQLFYETHLPEQLRESVETHQCIAGNNLFVHRSLFEKHRLFREIRSGSDIEFSKRVSRQGNRCGFAERAVVYRQCDLSNWQYLKRCYRIRRGQGIHFETPKGLGSLIGVLRKLPWRPGFRAGRSAPRPSTFQSQPGFATEWLYRWAVRWAGFSGTVSAACRRSHGVETVPPRYQGPPVEALRAGRDSLVVLSEALGEAT